jgi:uncharacterized protein (TIGR02466 family)
MNIYPLFSSPVVEIQVEEDLSQFNKIKSNYEFVESNSIGSNNSFTTINRNILDDFPEETKILLKYFNSFKDDALKFDSTKFRLTTSWATKTKSNGYSQFHNHTNSVFSGVLYFDHISGGDIEFTTTDNHTIQLNPPSEINLLNMRSFFLRPRKNTLLFFPSYLLHRISENKSEQDRYSLAFNLFPTGSIIAGDSSITF